MMDVLIVEDNYEDMEYCVNLLKGLNTDINIIKVGTGKKAMDILLQNNVDIAFIDIYLPDCNGLKLASEIRKIPEYQLLNIVFITVEQDRQMEAYKKFHCYDYIIKPFSPEQFYSATELLFKGMENQKKADEYRQIKKYITLNSKNGSFLIEKEKILFAKSSGKTLDIFMNDRIIPNLKIKISELVSQIDDPFFVRCHKSFAVNIRRICCVETRKNYTWDVTFDSDHQNVCYISRTYYKTILELLKRVE